MKYIIYKLRFIAPVHFGKNSLSDSECTMCSDAFFSALCLEAVHSDQSVLDAFVNAVRNGSIKISDAFPYIDDEYFLPKPYVFIERTTDGDSTTRKAYKALKYIPMRDYDSFLKGDFDVFSAKSLRGLGVSSVKISASVRNGECETLPYEVGTFSFNDKCGLYYIVECGDDECESLLDDMMLSLSHCGIGGKRSSGYGRFTFDKSSADEWLINNMSFGEGILMLLNTAFPQESELEEVLDGANYSLIKRSGFVASTNYADSWQRKKDVFMFKSGSTFKMSFEGDVYDVSTEAGSHPVYRYGKPFFMRIDV